MAKKMLIDATHAEETRVVVVDGNKVEEFDFESQNKRQLAGNIYLAKVTRVEPSLQAAFVDYGGNRHGFLAFSEIHPDYYQIPVADREALMEEERAYAEAMKAQEEDEAPKKPRRRSRAAKVKDTDAVTSTEPTGMETIDTGEGEVEVDVPEDEAASPMETVAETPVETPTADEASAEGGDDAPDAGGAADSEQPSPEAPASDEAAASDDAPAADAAPGDGSADEDPNSEDEDDTPKSKAADKDDSIESVADDDDHEDIRPPRKPRPRRYKIQEVIKVRQILLVQVVKEERGNKGAALTTYLSLAGRYCVLMPNTARGGGISRKITNAADRKKLKEIANEIEVPQGAGLIVRTAGAKRTKAEIKRDYEYLQRLWEQIRELTLKSIAPAKIYEEGDLIKRSIRDLYTREIDEVQVEGERGYRIAKDFMKMIMPSHAKNVKQYQDSLPLFARFQVETYLAGMFNPTVQLKSGGYIVIGVTEALVAIDVNSGRATKEGSIEETATKTNLEAAEEVARQLRLRDLAGLIVIDFIDMDERKNNAKVEKLMKEKLKTDRARIQVGRISGFGLMEMSRQRLRPGMIEATTQPCPHCHGTGLIRSDGNMSLSILRQIEEEGTRGRSREVLVRAPVAIANFLMNQKRDHIAQIEGRYGLSVRIEGDPHLISPDFAMEKFKTASRVVQQTAPVVSVDTSIMDEVDEAEAEADAALEAAAAVEDQQTDTPEGDTEGKPKRRRRRRRRRKGGGENGEGQDADENNSASGEAKTDDAAPAEAPAEPTSDGEADEKPKRKRTRRRKKPADDAAAASDGEAASEDSVADVPSEPPAAESAPAETPADAAPAEEAPAPSEEVSEASKPDEEAAEDTAEDTAEPETADPEPAAAEAEPEPEPEPAPEPVADAPEEPAKPKRRGWWSLGSK
ncbi:MAG: ribonuclease E/G [Pseudomonadota bacterium]